MLYSSVENIPELAQSLNQNKNDVLKNIFLYFSENDNTYHLKDDVLFDSQANEYLITYEFDYFSITHSEYPTEQIPHFCFSYSKGKDLSSVVIQYTAHINQSLERVETADKLELTYITSKIILYYYPFVADPMEIPQNQWIEFSWVEGIVFLDATDFYNRVWDYHEQCYGEDDIDLYNLDSFLGHISDIIEDHQI